MASGESNALQAWRGGVSPPPSPLPCTVSPSLTAPHFWGSSHVSSKPQHWRSHQTTPSLPLPLKTTPSLPLLLKTVILQADNEERTTIQKDAWLWRLRTCPNCTCRFPFPGADGPWLRCTCRRPAPCLSVTYLVRACRPWPAPHPALPMMISPHPPTSPRACRARLLLLHPPFGFL